MGNFSRRDFLKATAVTLGSACCGQASGLFAPHLAVAQTKAGTSGRVWIQLLLEGGNDCENTLVPYGLADYYTAKSTIAIPQGSVRVTENGVTGLHPSLANIHAAFQAGDVAIVRRVGTASASGSHDTEQRALSGFQGNTGYMGRLWDAAYNQGASLNDFNHFTLRMGVPPDAYCLRPEHRPATIFSVADAFSNVSGIDFSYSGTQENAQFKESLQTFVGLGPSTGIPGVSKAATEKLFDTIATVKSAEAHWNSTGGPNLAAFGGNVEPAHALRDACIIAQGLQAGIFGSTATIINCWQRGYDTHSKQGGVTGNHATLLQRLDTAIGAFRNRALVRGFWDRVVITIVTDFSRQVGANSNVPSEAGTDHGNASILFAIGGGINGGVRGTALTNSLFQTGPGQNENQIIPVSYRIENFYDQIAEWVGLDPSGLWGSYTPPNYGISLV